MCCSRARVRSVSRASRACRWKSLRTLQPRSACSALKRNLKNHHGTVGAVALDQDGNLAAATSTGGYTGKLPGRIGDSPLIGAGNYADNRACAVSGTGLGEAFIRAAVAYDVAARMRYRKEPLGKAAAAALANVARLGGDGGLIAVDRRGNVAMPFNSEGMYRALDRSPRQDDDRDLLKRVLTPFLFQLDVGRLDHFAPAREVVAHLGAELLRANCRPARCRAWRSAP